MAVRRLSDMRDLTTLGGVCVIDFTAAWCRPCQAAAPLYERLASEQKGTVFFKCDVDEASAVADAFAIESLPTFVVYRGGAALRRVEGADIEQLRAELHSVLADE